MVGLSDFSKFKQVPTPQTWLDWSNSYKNNSTNYSKNSLKNRRTLFNYIFQPDERGQIGLAWRGKGCIAAGIVEQDKIPSNAYQNETATSCEEINDQGDCENHFVEISKYEHTPTLTESPDSYFQCEWRNVYEDKAWDKDGNNLKMAHLHFNYGCCFATGENNVMGLATKEWAYGCANPGQPIRVCSNNRNGPPCETNDDCGEGEDSDVPVCQDADPVAGNSLGGPGRKCAAKALQATRNQDQMVVPGNPVTGLCEGNISELVGDDKNVPSAGICQRFADLAGLPIIYLTSDCNADGPGCSGTDRWTTDEDMFALAKTYPRGCSIDISGRLGGAVVHNDSRRARYNVDEGTDIESHHWPIHYVPNSAVPICKLKDDIPNKFYRGPVVVGESNSLFYFHSDDPHQRYINFSLDLSHNKCEGGFCPDGTTCGGDADCDIKQIFAEDADAWWNKCSRFGDNIVKKEFDLSGTTYAYCVSASECQLEGRCAKNQINYDYVSGALKESGVVNKNANTIKNATRAGDRQLDYKTTEFETAFQVGIPKIYDENGGMRYGSPFSPTGGVNDENDCELCDTFIVNICDYDPANEGTLPSYDQMPAVTPSSVANYYVKSEADLPPLLTSNSSLIAGKFSAGDSYGYDGTNWMGFEDHKHFVLKSEIRYEIPDKLIIGTQTDTDTDADTTHDEISEQVADEICYSKCVEWNATTKGPRCMSWVRSARPESIIDSDIVVNNYKEVTCRLNSQPLGFSTGKLKMKGCRCDSVADGCGTIETPGHVRCIAVDDGAGSDCESKCVEDTTDDENEKCKAYCDSKLCDAGETEVDDATTCGWSAAINVNLTNGDVDDTIENLSNGSFYGHIPIMYRDFSPRNSKCSNDIDADCTSASDCSATCKSFGFGIKLCANGSGDKVFPYKGCGEDEDCETGVKCVGGTDDNVTDWIAEPPWNRSGAWRGNNMVVVDATDGAGAHHPTYKLGCGDSDLKFCQDLAQPLSCEPDGDSDDQECYGTEAICCDDCTNYGATEQHRLLEKNAINNITCQADLYNVCVDGECDDDGDVPNLVDTCADPFNFYHAEWGLEPDDHGSCTTAFGFKFCTDGVDGVDGVFAGSIQTCSGDDDCLTTTGTVSECIDYCETNYKECHGATGINSSMKQCATGDDCPYKDPNCLTPTSMDRGKKRCQKKCLTGSHAYTLEEEAEACKSMYVTGGQTRRCIISEPWNQLYELGAHNATRTSSNDEWGYCVQGDISGFDYDAWKYGYYLDITSWNTDNKTSMNEIMGWVNSNTADTGNDFNEYSHLDSKGMSCSQIKSKLELNDAELSCEDILIPIGSGKYQNCKSPSTCLDDDCDIPPENELFGISGPNICHLDFSQGDTLVQFSTETGLPDPKPVKINTDNYFSGKLANIVYNPLSDTFNGAYTSLREHHEELAACAPGVCTANNFILSPE